MKRIVVLIIVLLLIAAAIFYIPKYVNVEGAKEVNFSNLEQGNIPGQIKEVLPKYRQKEKALVCKVNDEVYVVVTRGEKKSSGYEVDINKITISKEDKEQVLKVYAQFIDPKPGEVTTQIITYPYIIVKTDLSELPDKVILEKEYTH